MIRRLLRRKRAEWRCARCGDTACIRDDGSLPDFPHPCSLLSCREQASVTATLHLSEGAVEASLGPHARYVGPALNVDVALCHDHALLVERGLPLGPMEVKR